MGGNAGSSKSGAKSVGKSHAVSQSSPKSQGFRGPRPVIAIRPPKSRQQTEGFEEILGAGIRLPIQGMSRAEAQSARSWEIQSLALNRFGIVPQVSVSKFKCLSGTENF